MSSPCSATNPAEGNTLGGAARRGGQRRRWTVLALPALGIATLTAACTVPTAQAAASSVAARPTSRAVYPLAHPAVAGFPRLTPGPTASPVRSATPVQPRSSAVTSSVAGPGWQAVGTASPTPASHAVTFLAAATASATPSDVPAAAATPAGANAPSVTPPGWRLTFEDNFASSPVLNRADWGVYNGPGNGSPRSAQNTFISNGDLVLQTSKIGNTWTSAGVSSARVTTQTYGMYLARVRVDAGAGVRAVALLWPTVGWPPEVDFMEFGGSSQANRSWSLLTDHFGANRMQHARVNAGFTAWHTVGLIWTPQALTYTLDGRVVATMTQHVPHQPMWLGFQTGVEPASSGHAPNSSTPAHVDLRIAWVAVYHQG